MKDGARHEASEETKSAVALRYERDADRAPYVVAAGEGALAERILKLAREHDVPVQEDPELLGLLAQCAPGQEVPVELFGPVAGLLAYLYSLNEELAEATEPTSRADDPPA